MSVERENRHKQQLTPGFRAEIFGSYMNGKDLTTCFKDLQKQLNVVERGSLDRRNSAKKFETCYQSSNNKSTKAYSQMTRISKKSNKGGLKFKNSEFISQINQFESRKLYKEIKQKTPDASHNTRQSLFKPVLSSRKLCLIDDYDSNLISERNSTLKQSKSEGNLF